MTACGAQEINCGAGVSATQPAKMPRGFLVKRSRRASYHRLRNRDREKHWDTEGVPDTESSGNVDASWDRDGDVDAPPGATERPLSDVSNAGDAGLPDRCVTSPQLAQSLSLSPAAVSHCHPERKAAPRGSKAARKRCAPDDLSVSPVLGLRIRRESPERIQLRAAAPLGGFVCQLCREEYRDPPSLAQHRCSRIVRVEYRCPECDKTFSCPANLASHRRWHKPRGAPPEKENSNTDAPSTGKTAGGDQHHRAGDSAARTDARRPPQHAGASDEAEEAHECHYCDKTFRKHAYLRKHLAAHLSPPPDAPPPLHLSFPWPFPTQESRDTHALWRAEQQHAFGCKLCPSTFFSCPGLMRHVSRCHPAEGRALLLPPLAAGGPDC